MAGEVFAYLAVPAYSVQKSKAGGDSRAWLLLPRRASGAGGPGGRTGRASWASAPPPDPRPWPPRQTCCPAESGAGSEAGERRAGGCPGGPHSASRVLDARKPALDDGYPGSPDSPRCRACLQLNCKKSGGYLIAPPPVKVFDAPFGREGGSGGRCFAAPSSLLSVPNFSKL